MSRLSVVVVAPTVIALRDVRRRRGARVFVSFPAATAYVTPDAIHACDGVVDGRAETAAEAHVRHGRVDRIVRDPLDAFDHLGDRP